MTKIKLNKRWRWIWIQIQRKKRRTPLTILSNLMTITKMKMRNQDEDVDESKMRNQIVTKMKMRTKTTMKNPIMRYKMKNKIRSMNDHPSWSLVQKELPTLNHRCRCSTKNEVRDVQRSWECSSCRKRSCYCWRKNQWHGWNCTWDQRDGDATKKIPTNCLVKCTAFQKIKQPPLLEWDCIKSNKRWRREVKTSLGKN